MSNTCGADGTVSNTVLELLRDTGALLEGHFLLSSGLHSERYFQCALLLQHPHLASTVGQALGDACRHLQPETVVSPALGGIVIGHEVARALSIRALFTEREEGALRFRRGFSLVPGEKVLVVEDVVTTGRSSIETVKVVEAAGGKVMGLGAIIDRGGGTSFPLPFHALLGLRTPAFEPRDCPFCMSGEVPLTKPGSRDISAE